MSAPLSADLARLASRWSLKANYRVAKTFMSDGQVEGSISLKNNSLTVGPHGQVKSHG